MPESDAMLGGSIALHKAVAIGMDSAHVLDSVRELVMLGDFNINLACKDKSRGNNMTMSRDGEKE